MGFQDQQQMGRHSGNDTVRRSRFLSKSKRHQARKTGCRRILWNVHLDTRVRILVYPYCFGIAVSDRLDGATICRI